MIHVTYTDLRSKLAYYLDRALNDKAPILITRQKSEPVVMMAQSEYEGMLETMHLNSSPRNAARLDEAIARLNAGEGVERTLIDP